MGTFLSYTIFGFAVCAIGLGYNYFIKNPSNPKNKRFLLFCLSSALWSLGFGFLIIQTTTDKAWLCRSIGMIGVFPYIYFGLSLLGYLADSSEKEKKLLKYSGLFGFIIYPFIIDPKIQSFELTNYGMAYSFNTNFWVTLYNIYFIYVLILIVITITKFKRKTDLKRKRVTYRTILLYAIMLAIGATLDTVFPALGLVSFPGSTITQFFGVCLIYSALSYEIKNSTSIENIAQYIFHLSNFPIIVFNSKNKLSLISDSACEFLGITKNDTNVMIQDIFDSDNEILNENNTGKEYKCSLNNSICELSIQKVMDNYGDTVGYVVIIYDLTEKNKMISELEKAKIEAENASKAKENFLANISHEIRTPLNVVLGMNEMLYNETDIKLIKEYSNNIDEAGKNLLNTINDVLDFSKIQSGKLDIVKSDYNLKETVTNITELLRKKFEAKGLLLNIDINNDIPQTLIGDKMRIEQILLNLMDNSLKYTAAGKIKVEVNAQKIDKDNVNVIISVKDTGCGISKNDIDNLFTSFKRLEEDKNRVFEGTGLGLAITKKLIDAMDGKIEVESEVGVGSKFTIIIPHEISPSKENIKEESKTEVISTNEELDIPNINILAVDDNKTNLLVFKGLLKKTNAKIDTTLKGSEAIELFKSNNYDIVFLDHMMPEMDGIEVLKKIRELEKDKEKKTPVIVLTANAMEGSKEEYLSYGFNDYLSKPVNGAALKSTLKKYLFDNESNDKVVPTIDKPTNVENKEEEQQEQLINQNEQKEFIEDKKEEQIKVEQRDFIDEKEEEKINKVEKDIHSIREFIEDKKEHINSDLTNSFEKVKRLKESGITNLDDYSSALEELKKIAKSKGFTKLTQRAYVHFLKSKDKDIDYLNEHFIDLENEYNNVI